MTMPFETMEAKLVEALPVDPGWQFEPKWDGFRCLAMKQGGRVELFAKSGKPLGRYFPDAVETVAAVPADGFVLDGELIIPVDGTPSFDALQMRLHPAESRVRKLVAEHRALYVGFDLPVGPDGSQMREHQLAERRAALEAFVAAAQSPGLRLSPATTDGTEAERWLAETGSVLDGVIAKRLDGPYASGERAMLKVKRVRTADCVVGGFRYGSGSRLVGSLLLGLYDEAGLLHHVGFTSMLANAEKPALTARLEALRGEGFTGRAPGGPSRWSNERTSTYEPLRPELVVEVGYDQVTGDRLRHGSRLVRWRPDKAPRQCTFAQIAAETRPDALIGRVIGG